MKHRTYRDLDDVPRIDGDALFVGVDMQRDPGVLPAGFVSEAKNVRFEDGGVRSRGGHLATVWTNTSEAQTQATPLGQVYGVGVFSDPKEIEFIVVACASAAYLIRAGSLAAQLDYPEGVTVDGPVEIVQAFDKLFMFRGEDKQTLEWSGIPGEGWEMYDETDPGGGFRVLPRSSTAAYFQNRLFVATDRNTVVVSDILDSSQYDPLEAQFFINSGSDDSIVALVPYLNNNLLIFKDQSVYMLTDVSDAWGDFGNSAIHLLTDEVGCVAKDSIVSIGNDVLFLSDRGVYSVRQALDTRIQAEAVPISEPISPLFARVNYSSVGAATATYFEGRYYLAVPFDSATRNNAVFVYSFRNQTWDGYDTTGDAAFEIHRLVKFDFAFQRHLVAISEGGHSYLYAFDQECRDRLTNSVSFPVESLIRTRGYISGTADRKRVQRLAVDIATWDPTYSIGIISDGVNERSDPVQNQTRNRVKYLIRGKADYDLSNDNNDFFDPYRQDYSVLAGTSTSLQGGLELFRKQEYKHRLHASRRGRWIQVEVRNTTGAIELRAVTLDALPGERRDGKLA